MRISSLFAVFSIILFIPFSASASEYRSGDKIIIEPGKTIEGNLIVVGSEIRIGGDVIGDAYCAGKDIEITGRVWGSVFCGGERILLASTTAGSVYIAGGDVALIGRVMQNFYSLSNRLETDRSSSIGWEFAFSAAEAKISGLAEKDVYGSAPDLKLGGKIGRNASFFIGSPGMAEQGLEVLQDADIKGNLVYYADKEALISREAKIGGTVEKKQDKVQDEGKHIFYGWLKWRIFGIFSALISGLFIVSVFRRQIIGVTDGMLLNISSGMAIGGALFFLVPIASVILGATIIGLPLAFCVIALWLICLYVGKLLAGILIGRSIIEKISPESKDSLIRAMIVGLVIAELLYAVPIAGWALAFLASIWGLGALAGYFYKKAA